MKRLVLSLWIIGLLSSSGYAKQIAYCQSNGLNTEYIESCLEYTNKGSNSIKNIKTIGGMYSLGWRLITVSTHAWGKTSNGASYAINSYFYFEK